MQTPAALLLKAHGFCRFPLKYREPVSAKGTMPRRRPRRRRLGPGRDVDIYFAAAGNAGSLATSRASCWITTVALRFAAIVLMRSSDATVWARSVLNVGTPLLS